MIAHRGWGTRLLRVAVSLLLLGAGTATFVALGKRMPEERAASPEDVANVQIVAAAPHDEGISFEVDGIVVPFREVAIAAEVAGRVVEKSPNCRVGRTVRGGSVLLQLDRRDYLIERKRLSEQLEQADGNLAELDVQLANARRQIETANEDLAIAHRELQRYETARDPGVFAASEIDAARRAELSARDALLDVEDQLKLLEASKRRLLGGRETVQADLERAELDLERTTIRAPLDGVVTQDAVEQNGYVQRGTTVVTLRDTSSLDVKCSLHMHQLNWLWQAAGAAAPREGQIPPGYTFPEASVQVVYELEDRRFGWRGVLQRYEGAMVDEQTRMVPCRVFVDAPLEGKPLDASSAGTSGPPALMVGMFVKVHVDVKPLTPLVRVPRAAVHPGNTVWVIEADRLRRRQVHVADSEEQHVLVYERSGQLIRGEPVVVSPLASPQSGVPVKVLPSS